MPRINDKIMLCGLVYQNLDENISLKGSENEVGNGESTNEISHISNLRYVLIEQTLQRLWICGFLKKGLEIRLEMGNQAMRFLISATCITYLLNKP